MNHGRIVFFFVVVSLLLVSCGCDPPSSDKVQRQQQEAILAEGTAQVGMPAIKNFRERKMLKDIIEMRDQTGLLTYTYLWSDMQGKLVFFCDSIGFGIPYATQFTNPEKPIYSQGIATMPQADPNGLFSPVSAEGTWILCQDPADAKNVRPIFVEPRMIVSQFKLL